MQCNCCSVYRRQAGKIHRCRDLTPSPPDLGQDEVPVLLAEQTEYFWGLLHRWGVVFPSRKVAYSPCVSPQRLSWGLWHPRGYGKCWLQFLPYPVLGAQCDFGCLLPQHQLSGVFLLWFGAEISAGGRNAFHPAQYQGASLP